MPSGDAVAGVRVLAATQLTVVWPVMTEVAVERWHWTVEGYEQAAAAGVFGPEPRVELIAGEVFNVAPMLPGRLLRGHGQRVAGVRRRRPRRPDRLARLTGRAGHPG